MELVPKYRFEALVSDALDDLPDELLHVLDNVVVQVRDRHPDEPDLLGLYEGVPHTERTGMEGPDVVSKSWPGFWAMLDALPGRVS